MTIFGYGVIGVTVSYLLLLYFAQRQAEKHRSLHD